MNPETGRLEALTPMTTETYTMCIHVKFWSEYGIKITEHVIMGDITEIKNIDELKKEILPIIMNHCDDVFKNQIWNSESYITIKLETVFDNVQILISLEKDINFNTYIIDDETDNENDSSYEKTYDNIRNKVIEITTLLIKKLGLFI